MVRLNYPQIGLRRTESAEKHVYFRFLRLFVDYFPGKKVEGAGYQGSKHLGNYRGGRNVVFLGHIYLPFRVRGDLERRAGEFRSSSVRSTTDVTQRAFRKQFNFFQPRKLSPIYPKQTMLIMIFVLTSSGILV